MASLVQLGKRIFLLGGASNVTEEFNLTTYTWSVVAAHTKNNFGVNANCKNYSSFTHSLCPNCFGR
jgi:hypothetical protein